MLTLISFSVFADYSPGEQERVEISDSGKWYPGIVLETGEKGFYVSYDGYASNYDEWVPASRLRKLPPIEGISYIPLKTGTIKISGSIAGGKIQKDLSWAERSDVACWPGIRNFEFKGKQVYYWIDIPEKSEVKITVIPTDGKRINLFAYTFSTKDKNLPPLKYGLQRCEADHPQWVGKPNLEEKPSPKSVIFQAPSRRDSFLIGVSGAEGVVDGKFDLEIELKH